MRRVPPEVRFVKGDIRDTGLDALLLEEKVDTVFHLAAQVDVRKSVEDPVFDAEVNVLGTIRVAQASALAGVAQVVFSSSGGAIYGDPVGERADEEHPLNPCSAYGVAKLAGEKYLAALAPDAGYLLTILRYANVYGPRQDGRGEAGVVGIWMNRLLSGQDAVVNGDGGQTRDFVHVADVVAANQAAFLHRVPGTFNVGTGVETSIEGALPPRRQRLRNRRSPAFRPRQAGRAAPERPRPVACADRARPRRGRPAGRGDARHRGVVPSPPGPAGPRLTVVRTRPGARASAPERGAGPRPEAARSAGSRRPSGRPPPAGPR